MGKYKVCVYAIAKNEEKFVNKWVDSMSEADEIYVLLDPTSTDNTKQLLLNRGVKVTEKLIRPWRFDKARNESLKLVPKNADICVCTDLDEVFSKGWRKELEENWQTNTNQAVYKFWHNAGTPDAPPNIFNYSKIHDRKNFKWKWIIHEYIVPKKEINVNQVTLNNVMLYHYPDSTKPRSYKNLLEQAVKLDKKDTRYQGLLAEEYVNAKEYDKAINVLNKLKNNKVAMLNMGDFCLVYKFLIRIALKQGDFNKAENLCYYAISKCNYCKIFYGELGQLLILHKNENELGIANLKKCLSITEDVIVARETEWNNKAQIYNLISIGYYNLKDYVNALLYIDLAIKNAPGEQSYEGNKELYINAFEELN